MPDGGRHEPLHHPNRRRLSRSQPAPCSGADLRWAPESHEGRAALDDSACRPGQSAGPAQRPAQEGWEEMSEFMCRNKNCENFNKEANLHEYCDKCVRMANEVMSNARCIKTGNKPEFDQALRIAEYALRIYQNTYSSPEQLEWATMIYPSGWADLFEGVQETHFYEKG